MSRQAETPAHRSGRWGPVLAFWAAYVLTRPLGASFADWVGKPTGSGGLGAGDGVVALVLGALIACGVAYYLALRARSESSQQCC